MFLIRNFAGYEVQMENSTKTQKQGINNENANNPSHYVLMTVGIVVIMVGIFLRFIIISPISDVISNVIFIIGVFFALKAVLRILQ